LNRLRALLEDSNAPYLEDIYEEIHRRSTRLGIILRTAVVSFLAIWLLVYATSYADFLYHFALSSILVGVGVAHFMLANTMMFQRWHSYVFVVVDAILLTAVLFFHPYGEMLSESHVSSNNIVYYILFITLTLLTYSPRLILASMVINVLAWNIGMMNLPMGLVSESMNNHQWLHQSILMFVHGILLAFGIGLLRQSMTRQIVAEREFYDVLVTERGASHSSQVVDFTDKITGLGTRAAFDRDSALFTKVFAEGRLSDLTIAFIDLDGAQTLKQKQGQQSFEELLKVFADIARTQFRSSDMLYRFKDAHFALLAPGATMRNVERLQTLLNNIMQKLVEQGFADIEAKMGLTTLHEAQRETDET
jgi:GGDEF domain-containing protein